MRGSILAVAAGVLIAGCSNPRKEASDLITPEEAKALRIDAGQVYKDIQEKRVASEYVPLKPNVWPARFKKYKPLRVGLYRDGIALAIEGDAANEQGIHITPVAMDLAPSRGRVRYEKIQTGVYWYRFGN